MGFARNVHATVRLGRGSVNLVRFGSGEEGRLGVSRSGLGVLSSAIVHDRIVEGERHVRKSSGWVYEVEWRGSR